MTDRKVNRRSVLAAVGSGCLLSSAGCSSFRACPAPDLDDQPPYEEREIHGLSEEGVELVTTNAAVERLGTDLLEPADREWIAETNFDTAVLIGFHHGLDGHYDNIRIVGVERSSGEKITVYGCGTDPLEGDVLDIHAGILRIRYDDVPPTAVELVHWTQGDRTTYTDTA